MENKLINKKVNEKKTKDLLSKINKGLLNKNDMEEVSIEDIGKFLKQEGVVVKVHAGRLRSVPGVRIKTLNSRLKKDIKDDNIISFIENHISSGKIFFLPIEIESNLIRIENGLRQKQRTLSLGYDGSFMPIKTFYKFKKEYFDKSREEFFKIMNNICSNWDDIVSKFKESLKVALAILEDDENNSYEKIVSNIPTKEQYRSRFYMRLSVSAFPIMDNVSLFSDDIKKQMKNGLSEDTIALIYEVIINAINDAFITTCRLLKKDKINPKTWSGISNCIKRIKEKNVLQNPIINKIGGDLQNLLLNKEQDIDLLTEDYIEPILAQIYGYAKDIGYSDKIDFKLCNYSKDDLYNLYSILS